MPFKPADYNPGLGAWISVTTTAPLSKTKSLEFVGELIMIIPAGAAPNTATLSELRARSRGAGPTRPSKYTRWVLRAANKITVAVCPLDKWHLFQPASTKGL